jgi:hypothetical protein
MNNDEELMKALGRTARAEPALDERWDKLAAGTLTDAEREALLEEAARSDAAAEAYEAFRPLGAEFQARIVHRLLGETSRSSQRAAGEPASRGARAVAAAPASGGAQSPEAAAKVIPFRRRATRVVAVPLALAASLLLAVGVFTFMRPGTVPALPGYGLTLEGQVTLMRGEAPPPAAAPFAQGNHFRLVLTPATRVEGEVVARGYVFRDGEPAPFVAPAPRISDDGAVLIEGEVGHDVQLPQGNARLLVVVGREAKLPDPRALAEQLGAAGQEQSDDWAAWMLPVRSE